MPASDPPVRAGRERGPGARRHHVGRLADFPEGRLRVVSVGATDVGIVRTPARLYGVRDRCPHMGARICAGDVLGTFAPSAPDCYDYRPEELVLRCPWHRWEWSLDSGLAVGRTTTHRLRRYRVEVEGDDVYVLT